MWFALPGLLLTMLAQFYVTSTYSKYSKISAGKDGNGFSAAEDIKNGENFPVKIQANEKPLGDYFNPITNTVSLSSENVSTGSVANIAVVAHEMGHVQQKFTSSFIYNFRKVLVPVTNIGTQIGYVLFFLGLALSMLQLSQLGVILFSTSVLFSLITVPVELDASNRGMKFIQKYDLISENNRKGARRVLTAAALTYFAGLLTSILNLLYYVNILRRRN